jgi:hypothetical protein
MSLLLARLPVEVPGTTVNRLCGSSMDAIALAARAIKAGEMTLMIAGGVESMTRAPFVTGKADAAFSRSAHVYDTTIGWRFVNPLMKARYGVDSMPETAENVAVAFKVSRADQTRRAAQPATRSRGRRRGPPGRGDRAGVDAQKRGEPLVGAMDFAPRARRSGRWPSSWVWSGRTAW